MPDVVPGPLRVAVLGPGGVGGLLGNLLARAGHEVTMLARPATADHLTGQGLELRSEVFGDSVEPVHATTALDAPVDVVLVTVKATSLEDALPMVPADALGRGLVVPFLNGLEHVDRLRQVYPPDQVAAGTIAVEAERTSPGVVVHRSPFALVELAAGRADPAQVQRVADALGAAGPSVSVRDGERQVLWDKLSVLAPLALFTTSEGAPFGVARDRHWDDITAMVTEIADAAAAEGVTVDRGRVTTFLEGVPDGMRSSMQKDAEAGNAIEVDAIGGSLLRAGAAGGVAMPVTERLVRALDGLA